MAYTLQHTAAEIDRKLALVDENKNLISYPYDNINFADYEELEDVGDGSILITKDTERELNLELNHLEVQAGKDENGEDRKYVLSLTITDILENITTISGCELSVKVSTDSPALQTAMDQTTWNLGEETGTKAIIACLKIPAGSAKGLLIKPQIEEYKEGETMGVWVPNMDKIGTYVDRRFNSTNTKLKVLANDVAELESGLGQLNITYTNDTPMVEAHGGIAEGTTFDNVSIQDMLTMILYPYIDIDVGTVTASQQTGTYQVHSLPTLNSVTLTVKKNSATNLQFSLWDITKDKQVGNTLTEANISNNKLEFSGFSYPIDTTRTFKIKYTYKGEGGADSGEKTVNVGTFTIKFTNPTMENLSSNLGSYSWYNGQTASVTEITASMSDLGSASATGGITKIELYKNGTKVGDSVSKPSLPYKFTVSDSVTAGTTYKVKAYYNTRTGSSTTTSETSIEKDLIITFSPRAATISLTGLNSNTFSKLNPQSISGLGASFTKYSDKITSVKLLEGSSTVKTNTITGHDGTAYSETAGTTTFDYSKTNVCSTISLKAEAYNGTTKVATSDTKTLTFYAPYCYGFVDSGVTFSNLTADTLKGLTGDKSYQGQSSPKYPGSSSNVGMKLTNTPANKKFIFAVPNGTYNSAKDSAGNGDDNISAFETNAEGNFTRDIEFADGSKTSYQIFIEKDAAKQASTIDLVFKTL